MFLTFQFFTLESVGMHMVEWSRSVVPDIWSHSGRGVADQPSMVFVNDYHLLLLPSLLRQAGLPGSIVLSFFLHACSFS
jgi:hypothetical protein